MPHPLPEGLAGVRRMLDVCKTDEQRALISLCGLCGLRISEALAVRPSWFDLHTMEITVRGKGDKTRKIPVSDEAWLHMQKAVTTAYCTGTDELVVSFKDRFARSIVTRLGRNAQLRRRVASHDLRATFLTALFDSTLDLRLVQEIAGHAHSTTTEIYTLVTMQKMHKAVNDL